MLPTPLDTRGDPMSCAWTLTLSHCVQKQDDRPITTRSKPCCRQAASLIEGLLLCEMAVVLALSAQQSFRLHCKSTGDWGEISQRPLVDDTRYAPRPAGDSLRPPIAAERTNPSTTIHTSAPRSSFASLPGLVALSSVVQALSSADVLV